MMRKTGCLIIAGLLTGLSTTARADTLRLGADAAFVVPADNWSNTASFGFGGLVKAEWHALPNLALTGRIGYIKHLSEDRGLTGRTNANTQEIPVLVGAKFYLLEPGTSLYLAAEIGLVHLQLDADAGLVDISEDDVKFGLTGGFGFEYRGFDVRGHLFAPSVGDFGDFIGVMVTVGYAVTLF